MSNTTHVSIRRVRMATSRTADDRCKRSQGPRRGELRLTACSLLSAFGGTLLAMTCHIRQIWPIEALQGD